MCQTHSPDVGVLICDKRKRSGSLKRLLKRRSAYAFGGAKLYEPVIGHTKSDHALARNFLQGQLGDRVNALLVGCGFNVRKLCRFLASTALSPAQLTA